MARGIERYLRIMRNCLEYREIRVNRAPLRRLKLEVPALLSWIKTIAALADLDEVLREPVADEEVLDRLFVVSLQFDAAIFNGAPAGEFGLQLLGEFLDVHRFGIDALDHGGLFLKTARVCRDQYFLGLFRKVFANTDISG
jgi:hypothetical protein